MPKGIDPGWGYAPGRRAAAPFELFAEKLEGAPADMAQGALESFARSDAFARWVEKPKGPMPVMHLPDEAKAVMQSRRSIAVISQETMEKQRRRHPELTLGDYRSLPVMGADPTVIIQVADVKTVIIRRDERTYIAAAKTTRTGEAVFITSFRRTDEADVRALLRRGRIIYGSWQ